MAHATPYEIQGQLRALFGPLSLSLSLKDPPSSRPYSPENRLFLAILLMKFKIGAGIVKSWISNVEGKRAKGNPLHGQGQLLTGPVHYGTEPDEL